MIDLKEEPTKFAVCQVWKSGRMKKARLIRHDRDAPNGMSPGLLMVSHVWQHVLESCGHSWQKMNGSLRGALELAICGGFRFDLEDFQFMGQHYRTGYWLDLERSYADACRTGNNSACLAIESYLKRPPFIVLGHRLYVGKKIDECTSAFRSSNYHRPPAVIDAPEWLFYRGVEVGSFAGTDTVNLNSKHRPDGTWQDKAAKLWKVDRDGIKAANAAIRQAKKRDSEKTEDGQEES